MKKTLYFLFLAAMAAFVADVSALEPVSGSVPQRYSYAMGVRLGQLLKGQGIVQLDSAAFAAAIDDVLADRPLRLSDDQMREAIVEQPKPSRDTCRSVAPSAVMARSLIAWLRGSAGRRTR